MRTLAEPIRETHFELRDTDGDLVAIHERRDFTDGTKTFRWRRPDGTLGLGGLPTADLPLFGCHLLRDRPHDSVIITEGEKCAQFLSNIGLLALGTCCGASVTPSVEVLRPLIGRGVVLWPDADQPGLLHMQRIGSLLTQLGVTPRLIEWRDAPPGGDAADFIDQHGGGGALERLRLEARLISENDAATHGVLLADVRPQRLRWFWPGRIPLGKLVLLDGDPGLGKSLLTLDLAARITTGRPMPDGLRSDLDGPRGAVILTAEDDLADTVRLRLDALGADLARIMALPVLRGEDGADRMPTLLDLGPIEAIIQQINAALVVVDPLMAYVPDRRDTHRDSDIRRALAPVAGLAAKTGATFLLIRHLNKSGGGNPLYRGGGSIGIIGAARSGMLVAPDPDDPDSGRRVLAVVKSNLGALPPSLAYRVAVADGVPVIDWAGPTAHTAEALLAAHAPQEERGALEAACQFLREILADGPVPVGAVNREAHLVGIVGGTLRRARAKLGIVPQKTGFRSGWALVLPVPKTLKTSEDAHAQSMSAFGDDERLRDDPRPRSNRRRRLGSRGWRVTSPPEDLRRELGRVLHRKGLSDPPSPCVEAAMRIYNATILDD